MFQSYQHIKNIGYDQKTSQYLWKYSIIDSDFEEVAAGAGDASGVGSSVINTYGKRQLPVPINLALAFKYMHDQHGIVFENIIFYNRKYNPKYLSYAEETEKCLQRLIDMKAFW